MIRTLNIIERNHKVIHFRVEPDIDEPQLVELILDKEKNDNELILYLKTIFGENINIKNGDDYLFKYKTTRDLIDVINNSYIRSNKSLFHITDKSNLESIKEHGILSKSLLQVKGITPEHTGGNDESHEKDAERRINDYISLSLDRQHEMKWVITAQERLPKPVLLKISPEVLEKPCVKISFGSANAHNSKLFYLDEKINEIDTEVLYNWTDWTCPETQKRLKDVRRIEILIPYMIELKDIQHDCEEYSREEGKWLSAPFL